jgi:hypothetical protein
MKQAILNLEKKLLLVELPEGYVVVSVFPSKRTLTMWNGNGQYITEKLDFDVDEIGKLTDITESQFTKLVSGVIEYGKQENHPIWTAKKGFFSKLTEDKIYFKNPLGEFPTKQNTGLEYGMEYISKVQRWEEAESKVWDINRCWIFEIL